MKKKRFNFAWGHINVQWNEAAEAEPVEVLIYDTIGSDPWGDGGISSEDFKKTLDTVPKNRALHIRVNSKGGDVHEGLAMRNLLAQWPKNIITTIDGIAASTSSWAFSPNREGDEVRAPRASQMFIHDAIAFGFGNAEDLIKTANDLEKTSDQIAAMYADKTGKSKKAMRQMMKDETLLTGEEAEELGLVDTIIDGKSVRNFQPAELAGMKDRLKAFFNSVANAAGQTTNHKETQMKKRLIALLNKHGVTDLNGVKLSNSMTDAELEKVNEEQLEAAFDKVLNEAKTAADVAKKNGETGGEDLKALRADLAKLTEANNAAKKLRITNEVEKLITDDRIPAGMKDKAITRAMGDEEYLNELKTLEPKRPGGEPLRTSTIECTSEDLKTVQNFVLDNGPRFQNKFIGANTGNVSVDKEAMLEIRERGLAMSNAIKKNRDKLIAVFNANTLDAAMQRQVILQDLLRAFQPRVLVLSAFCKTFSNVPLEGTDKLEVPFFPLQTAASTDWNAANGYVTGDTEQDTREVIINKRKYQGMAFTSQELRRQPYQNWNQLAIMNAEKLAVDVNADVLSVVTVANYGASVKAVAAAAFSADDVADLYGSATDLNWPDTGRSLVLTTGYKVALLKDPAFKSALAYGTSDAIRRAAIKDAYGFEDIYTVPTANLPANAENLKGFINHLSAALVGTAPIMPAPAVRALMVQYDVVMNSDNGIAIEYRMFGDAQKDKQSEIVECNYGFAKGVATALARITSQ
jgi:ATP-dependent protease ClpP protease subunit